MKVKVIEYSNSIDVVINKYEEEKSALGKIMQARYNKCGNSFVENRENNIERVNRRRKKKIRELAKCNDWCYFVTLTFANENIDNYKRIEELRKFLKKIKRNEEDLQYLIIPEEHKNGLLHFHCLFSKHIKKFIKKNKHNKDSLIAWEISYGFTNVQKIKSINKVLKYIIKYITKDNVFTYLRSRNLIGANVRVLYCSHYIASTRPNFVDIFINLFLDLKIEDLNNFNFIDKDGCIFKFFEV